MPKRLPYKADDDSAAEHYVREALRRSQRGNWTALIADDRVMQTYRALRRIEASVCQSHIKHRDAIRQAKVDRDAGLITDEAFAEEHRSFVDWRRRASVFDGVLRQYLDMVMDRIRAVRRDSVVDCLQRSLLILALAVDSHREAHTGEESLADTALWARLRTLQWPALEGAELHPLADVVAAEKARRAPARTNRDGFIEFEGLRVFGETVDVADLILEFTDQVDTSIPRPKLVELWKQRTTDLAATDAAKVTSQRHVGSYTSHRLRKALMFLENLGAIDRDAARIQVTVIDRAKLSELRRRWDDKYSGLYDLE